MPKETLKTIDDALARLDKEMTENGWLDHAVRAVEKEVRNIAKRNCEALDIQLRANGCDEAAKSKIRTQMREIAPLKRFIIEKQAGSYATHKVVYYSGGALIYYPRFVLSGKKPTLAYEVNKEKNDWNDARLFVAHELGHILFHTIRNDGNGSTLVDCVKMARDGAELRKMENLASLFARRVVLLRAKEYKERVRPYYEVDGNYLDSRIRLHDKDYDPSDV